MTRSNAKRLPLSASSVDVAIIGAGPYGLSFAAHLGECGIEHRIFGHAMRAWREMSAGMHLKSLGFATSIATPDDFLSLPEYCRAEGQEDYEPIPIATFADYGVTVQQQLVPHLEETAVTDLDHADGQFRVTLEGGEVVWARRVVVAIGLSQFERIPAPFAALPRDLMCHTAHRSNFSDLAGLDVTVIGAGQSSLQAAALLHEHGAAVRLLARGQVHWGGQGRPDNERSRLERIRMPATVLGQGRDNWILQHVPGLMHTLPDDRRLRFLRTHLGPGGAWWLRERVEGLFPIHTSTKIVEALPDGEKVRLTLVEADGAPADVVTEYIVLGTGYDVDIGRIPFISSALASRICRIERAPALTRHFECSVPGLYFVGPSSAPSFGPLFRFVAGSHYTVPHVTRRLDRHRRRS